MKNKDTISGNWETLDEVPSYKLKLFITGTSPNSSKAITNLKNICDNHIKDKYELEIIDVYQQPLKAEAEQLIALPMLLRYGPLPVKRLFGDMSNEEKVLKGLGLNS